MCSIFFLMFTTFELLLNAHQVQHALKLTILFEIVSFAHFPDCTLFAIVYLLFAITQLSGQIAAAIYDLYVALSNDEPLLQCAILRLGTCTESDTGYACTCMDGFFGKNCDSSSRCRDMWCMNGGRCVDAVTSGRVCRCRRCSCRAEYIGSRCERNIVTNDPGQSPNSGSQAGIIYSKKTRTYIEENHSETRVVGVDTQTHTLNAPQWIAICVGSAVLVIFLVGSAVCLIYYKRRKYSTNTQHQYKEPTIELQTTRNIDFSIVADHSSSESPIILERTFQKPLNAEICMSTSSFRQKAENSSSADGDSRKASRDRSHSRSSGKLPIVLSDGHCFKRFSNHYVQPIQEMIPCAIEETIPLRRVSVGSSPMRHSNPESRTPGKRDRYSDRPRSLRHSLTRPPTYEEVCREKDALVRNGYVLFCYRLVASCPNRKFLENLFVSLKERDLNKLSKTWKFGFSALSHFLNARRFLL